MHTTMVGYDCCAPPACVFYVLLMPPRSGHTSALLALCMPCCGFCRQIPTYLSPTTLLPFTCSFLITNSDYSFIGISTQQLGLLVVILLSAIGGILLTALLHGELLAILGAGFQYWVMQPVFFNMLQVITLVGWLPSDSTFQDLQRSRLPRTGPVSCIAALVVDQRIASTAHTTHLSCLSLLSGVRLLQC